MLVCLQVSAWNGTAISVADVLADLVVAWLSSSAFCYEWTTCRSSLQTYNTWQRAFSFAGPSAWNSHPTYLLRRFLLRNVARSGWRAFRFQPKGVHSTLRLDADRASRNANRLKRMRQYVCTPSEYCRRPDVVSYALYTVLSTQRCVHTALRLHAIWTLLSTSSRSAVWMQSGSRYAKVLRASKRCVVCTPFGSL